MLEVERLVASRPKTNIATKLGDAEAGERGDDPVERARRQQHDAGDQREHDEGADEARAPGDRAGRVGEPGVRVLEEVPAGADPDDARGDLEVAQHERDLERDDQTDAITSVHDSIQPRNGWTMRVVNT